MSFHEGKRPPIDVSYFDVKYYCCYDFHCGTETWQGGHLQGSFMCPANERRHYYVTLYSVSPIYRGRVYRRIGYIADILRSHVGFTLAQAMAWCLTAIHYKKSGFTWLVGISVVFSRPLIVPLRWAHSFMISTSKIWQNCQIGFSKWCWKFAFCGYVNVQSQLQCEPSWNGKMFGLCKESVNQSS